MSLFLASLLVSSAFACAPNTPNGDVPRVGGQAENSPLLSSGTFRMKVHPPTSWTYPEKPEDLVFPQVAINQEQAHEQIRKDILEAVNAILVSTNLPKDFLKITLNPVSFLGTVVSSKDEAKCKPDGKTIAEPHGDRSVAIHCNGKGGAYPDLYPAQVVSGTFETNFPGMEVPEKTWTELSFQLQAALVKLGAVFPDHEYLVIKHTVDHSHVA